jgi:hypothetical protein
MNVPFVPGLTHSRGAMLPHLKGFKTSFFSQNNKKIKKNSPLNYEPFLANKKKKKTLSRCARPFKNSH